LEEAAEVLAAGRDAHRRHDWAEARERFRAARAAGELAAGGPGRGPRPDPRRLVPGGTFVMVEPRASSNLEDNLANPLAPFLYAVSTLHCMTVSLAHGGAGLGAAWGEQTVRAMLAAAGFGEVAVHEAPGDPTNAVFVTSRPGA
jgi:hypothetical protein